MVASREEEYERIYEKWFPDAPRCLFRAVDTKYGLTQSLLCDLGCSYGMNLIHCKPGSNGIEVSELQARFERSLSLNVDQRDLLEGDISDVPRAESIWCSAVLGHVDSPHVFLRRAHRLLVPGGLLAFHVPTVPSLVGLRPYGLPWIGKYFVGHPASDPINAFTTSSLTFFCERAVFETIEFSLFSPGPLRIFDRFPLVSNLIDGCTCIGHAVEGWEYMPRTTRQFIDNP